MKTWPAKFVSGFASLFVRSLIAALLAVPVAQAQGLAWSTATLLEAGIHAASAPRIAADPNGNVMAVWVQWGDDGNHYHIYANRYTVGSGWGTATLLETSDLPAGAPQIAFDANGNAIAVWHQAWKTTNGDRYGIYANRYVAGTGWGTATAVFADTAREHVSASGPQIAVDASGDALVVWSLYDWSWNHTSVLASRYVPGTGWSGATNLSGDVVQISHSQKAALDSNGNAIVVWHQEPGAAGISNSIMAVRYAAGTGWSTPVAIGGTHPEDSSAGPAAPQIAFDANANAVAVWYHSGKPGITANRYVAGTGWGTAQAISVPSGTGYTDGIHLAIDKGANAIALWHPYGGGFLYANRYVAGTGWGTTDIIDPEGQVNSPRIAFDPNGNAVAVWGKYSCNSTNVMSSRYVIGAGWDAMRQCWEGAPFGDSTINGTFNNTGEPQIVVDTNANATAVWVQNGSLYASASALANVPSTGVAATTQATTDTPANGGFEVDAAGTQGPAITGWIWDSYNTSDSGARGANPRGTFDLGISSDRYFSGAKSVRSFVRNNAGGGPGDADGRHSISELTTKTAFATQADRFYLWRSEVNYTTSSRWFWRLDVVLSDGATTQGMELACRAWGNSEGCSGNFQDHSDASATGADGQLWYRHTILIPEGMNRHNLKVTIRHQQDAWDGTTAESTLYYDLITDGISAGTIPQSDLRLWLKADEGVVLASGGVSAWRDQSGNGFDVVQVDRAKRPALVPGAAGGRPALSFDGDNDYLQTASTVNLLAGGDSSYLVVVKPGTSQKTHADIFDYAHAGGVNLVLQQNADSTNLFPSGSGVGQQLSASAYQVLSNVWDNGNRETSFLNGGNALSASIGASTYAEPNYLTVGNKSAELYPRQFKGEIAELIIYNTLLDDARRVAIENYLLAKYGLAAAATTTTTTTVAATTTTTGATTTTTASTTTTTLSTPGAYGAVNLAKNKTVTALTNTVRGTPQDAVDGDVSTVWYSYQGGSPNSNGFTVDLGASYSIGRMVAYPAQVHSFTLSTSEDGSTWTERYISPWTDAGVVAPIGVAVNGAYSARYVKFEGSANWNQYVGMIDFAVFEWLSSAPVDPAGSYGTSNLALNKTAVDIAPITSASSNPPSAALDGDASTSWVGSYSGVDDYWHKPSGTGLIKIDLGAEYPIGKITVRPERVHSYTLVLSTTDQVAANAIYPSGAHWKFRSYPEMFGTVQTSNDAHTFDVKGAITARYIWVETHTWSTPTPIQPSIAEIEIAEWIPAGAAGYGTVNLAKGKTVTPLTDTELGTPQNAVDGDVSTVWYSYQGSPTSNAFTLDLGASYSIGRMVVYPAQVHTFTLSTSEDGSTWTERYKSPWTEAVVTAPIGVAANGAYSARYLKFEGSADWNQYVGMIDVAVFEWLSSAPVDPAGSYGTSNLALNKTAVDIAPITSASSNPPSSALDGDVGTSWVGNYTVNEDKWNKPNSTGLMKIDLGAEYPIGKITVRPERVHSYTLVLSTTEPTTAESTYPAGAHWRFRSYPEMFGTVQTSNEAHTFDVKGAITARYIWVMSNVFESPTVILPSIAEIEVNEWTMGTTQGTTSTSGGSTTTTTGSSTTTTGSTTTTTLAGGGDFSFIGGWNLVGNSAGEAIDVVSAFSDTTKVTTVWKWVPSTTRWAFYAPSLGAQQLAGYAASKGYDVLGSIDGGEGYWVNAKTAFSLPQAGGTPIESTAFQTNAITGQSKLVTGWNLVAIGDSKTPSGFNKALSPSAPAEGEIPLNVTTLWAWDATLANWYFYAPSLEKSGGLANYIVSKNYLDFGDKVLQPTTGFWVNKP